MKAGAPFLILQLRPEKPAADSEYQAFLDKGALTERDTIRVCLDRETLPDDLNLQDLSGIIVGGGPGCVSDAHDRKSAAEQKIEDAIMSLMPQITRSDIPFMGCCYGISILAHHLGASVNKTRYGEPVGTSSCSMTDDGKTDALLSGLPQNFEAFVGHKEAVQHLPDNCLHLVSSAACPYQMIRHGQNVYATQFHPEADAQGFETRIEIYKHRGYFAPETADELVAMCRAANVHVPEKILHRFVERYKRT